MNVSSEEESDDDITEDNNQNNDQIISRRYNLDNYDDDDDGELGGNTLISLANMTVFASNDDDPYLQNDDNEDVNII